MLFRRAAGLLLLLMLAVPVFIFAEDGIAEDAKAESADGASFFDELTVSIDCRIGGNVFGPVPGIPFVIGVPLSLSPETVTLTPQVGFIYYFDVLTDYHNEFYVPIGLSAIYNPFGVGLDVTYYPAVGGSNTNHMCSVCIAGEAELLESGKFSLHTELKLGPMMILDPDGMRTFVSLNLVLIPRYTLAEL